MWEKRKRKRWKRRRRRKRKTSDVCDNAGTYIERDHSSHLVGHTSSRGVTNETHKDTLLREQKH